MTCDEARIQLHGLLRGRLEPDLEAEVRSHLGSCLACSRLEQAEATLNELLSQRLPRRDAPAALKLRLSMLADDGMAPLPAPARRRWLHLAAPALAAGVALVAGSLFGRSAGAEARALSALTGEAVSDHLRVLAAEHPLEIGSSSRHQVKPWFEGKLDFAPVVPELEGTELRLQGGAVGYFLDRRAAVMAYALRRHAVTLLAFRADGLPWPALGRRQIGPADGRTGFARGFQVVLWRAGGLGYALVSDIDAADLEALAGKLASATKGR